MDALRITNLCKSYPAFRLENVSFAVEEGTIMGLIGRNGAGKTTTLKSAVRLVRPDSGRVEMLGMDFAEHESECKQALGFVLGEVDYYPGKRLREIAGVTSRFYREWDEARYRECLRRFSLDDTKRVKELSAGMRVKFNLALALSHRAKLLLLDEPTSGLDPVSRDELIGIFFDLIADGQHSILFSTHIISDLEKCADSITYIKDGRVLASSEKDRFAERYVLARGGSDALTPELRTALIGAREHAFGFEGMLRSEDAACFDGVETEHIGLEEIMLHLERDGGSTL